MLIYLILYDREHPLLLNCRLHAIDLSIRTEYRTEPYLTLGPYRQLIRYSPSQFQYHVRLFWFLKWTISLETVYFS